MRGAEGPPPLPLGRECREREVHLCAHTALPPPPPRRSASSPCPAWATWCRTRCTAARRRCGGCCLVAWRRHAAAAAAAAAPTAAPATACCCFYCSPAPARSSTPESPARGAARSSTAPLPTCRVRRCCWGGGVGLPRQHDGCGAAAGDAPSRSWRRHVAWPPPPPSPAACAGYFKNPDATAEALDAEGCVPNPRSC